MIKYRKKMKQGSFESLEAYKQAQIETHHRKINLLWFCGLTARPLLDACKIFLGHDASSVVCLGSRNGLEPRFFNEAGFKRAVGLDISETANVFPYMMQHDFHELRPGYVSKFDVAYSNSFDHAYDLDKFFLATRSFLNDRSIILLDYSPRDNAEASDGEADCLAVGQQELIDRVSKIIGYQLLAVQPCDQNISKLWPHYRGLNHLIFGSPELVSNAAIKSKTIESVDFLPIKSSDLLRQHAAYLQTCFDEHLAYIDHTSSIKF